MSDEQHPFDRLTSGQAYRDRMTARANASFEEGKVNFLLSAFKLNARKVTAVMRRQGREGESGVTFRAFLEQYPSFPMLLGASRLNGVHLHTEPSAMIPALYKKFGATPFMAAYDEFYEANVDRADGKTVGLVFPRKGFKHGMLVYAADDPQILPFAEREAFFAYVGGRGKKDRHWVLVRSFQTAVEAIHNGGHGWRPA